MPRSDADKLSMEPIKVTLGTKEYKIELLRTLKQREWRGKLVEQMGIIMGNFSMDANQVNANVFHGGLISALVKCPEKLADLLFAYAPDLPKQTILEECTEEQIITAFSAIMEVAFPFLQVLKATTSILSTEMSNSARPDSSILH